MSAGGRFYRQQEGLVSVEIKGVRGRIKCKVLGYSSCKTRLTNLQYVYTLSPTSPLEITSKINTKQRSLATTLK